MLVQNFSPMSFQRAKNCNVERLTKVRGIGRQSDELNVVLSTQIYDFRREMASKIIPNNQLTQPNLLILFDGNDLVKKDL